MIRTNIATHTIASPNRITNMLPPSAAAITNAIIQTIATTDSIANNTMRTPPFSQRQQVGVLPLPPAYRNSAGKSFYDCVGRIVMTSLFVRSCHVNRTACWRFDFNLDFIAILELIERSFQSGDDMFPIFLDVVCPELKTHRGEECPGFILQMKTPFSSQIAVTCVSNRDSSVLRNRSTEECRNH